MDFTFGIITAGGYDHYIETIIKQIRNQEIPAYEIIIVGATKIRGSDIVNIPFDETKKRGWITRKKNMIAQAAKYENIVLLHDYVSFTDDWYKGYLQFGNAFQICVNPIKTINGDRFRDYLFFHNFNSNFGTNTYFIPYNYVLSPNLSKLAYVSGTYYVIKRTLALKIPLDEMLGHEQGEDIAFSQALALNDILIKCNPHSLNILLKEKNDLPTQVLSQENLKTMESLDDEQINDTLYLSIERQKYWVKQNSKN